MNVLIIEDEKPAQENIIQSLQEIREGIHVLAVCQSIHESLVWLRENQCPDLVLMDIQLSDGPSFQILRECSISCPVIFITAHDEYITEAFEYNSIDYLLKPLNPPKLAKAIAKYKSLQSHFVNNHSSLLGYLDAKQEKKSRVLVKLGIGFQAIKVQDIAYFFTEHKLIFLVDKENRKYLADKDNLAGLEEELDRKIFYRVNRKYIINANFIKKFKPLEKSKIIVELILPVNEEIIVSQESAPAFKRWIGGL